MRIGTEQFPPSVVTAEDFGNDVEAILETEVAEYLEAISPRWRQISRFAIDYWSLAEKEAKARGQRVPLSGKENPQHLFMKGTVEALNGQYPTYFKSIRDRARFLEAASVIKPSEEMTTRFTASVPDASTLLTETIMIEAPFQLRVKVWKRQRVCIAAPLVRLDGQMRAKTPKADLLLFDNNESRILAALQRKGISTNWTSYYREFSMIGQNLWLEITKGEKEVPALHQKSIAHLWWILGLLGTAETRRRHASMPLPVSDRLKRRDLIRLATHAFPLDLNILRRIVREEGG